VHRDGWSEILLEGFTLPIHYVTLYDHRDKYTEAYKDLMCKLLYTQSVHWRPTPSTTQTFATLFKTLKEDLHIHKQYSTNTEPSQDHYKFMNLRKQGRYLISSVPGYSTHAHRDLLSPCVDWEKYL